MRQPMISAAGFTATALALVLGASATGAALAQRAQQQGQPQNEAEAQARPVVETAQGPVRGFTKSGVFQFLGIPYARPPVGPLRWRPPRKPAQHSGTFDASSFGKSCAQITTLGVFAGPPNNNEDCLYLNIFTPRLGSGQRLPVLVWIHGGGFVDGSSKDYDGSKLAKDGPAVVVTINYRLGLLGYFAHPAIDHEGHLFGNYGLMDQQRALSWVRANIAAFGGDPHNVTLGGQSAGSAATYANMVSPRSRGLFHRAIGQSGPTLTMISLDSAEARGLAFADTAGCPGTSGATAHCLRSLSVAQIMALQGTASANGPYVTGQLVDGTLIPMPPDQAWESGQFNRMPVMNGTTIDEGSFGVSIREYFFGPLTAAGYDSSITLTYSGAKYLGGPRYPPGTVQRVLNHYPVSNYPSPSLALTAASSNTTACRARHLNMLLAQWVPVYAYEFVYRDAPYYFPPLSFPVGAAHTIDIQFLFPGWHGGNLGIQHPLNAQERQLSNRLVDFWTTFASDGNPNGDSRNRPWPRYVSSRDNYLVQDIPNLSLYTGNEFKRIHKCGFWDTVLAYQSLTQ